MNLALLMTCHASMVIPPKGAVALAPTTGELRAVRMLLGLYCLEPY